MKKIRLALAIALSCSAAGWHCNDTSAQQSPEFRQASEVVQMWQQMLVALAQNSEGYRPPVSARMFAYVGLAAWEAGRPAIPDALSFEGRLNGLHLPRAENSDHFCVGASLNAAYATLARCFFPHAARPTLQQCQDLCAHIEGIYREKFPANEVAMAEAFGRSVADSVFLWSATDSIGHEAYFYNFDQNYQISTQVGHWQPSAEHPMPALLPHWARARAFVVAPASCSSKEPLPFSENKGSEFFAQAMEVYSLSMPITEEKRWVAEFWSDDVPGVSMCAATRWISIALQAIQNTNASLPKSLETFLKIGFALNDVSIKVWQEKYAYDLERPETYIQRNIAPDWKPTQPAPPFPSYPSGHAGFGAASAVVLQHIFGASFSMTDRTHEGRKEFLGKPRRFESFQDMARESAISRLFLGVHYRMDSEEGLRVGEFIGHEIANLQTWQTATYLSQK